LASATSEVTAAEGLRLQLSETKAAMATLKSDLHDMSQALSNAKATANVSLIVWASCYLA